MIVKLSLGLFCFVYYGEYAKKKFLCAQKKKIIKKRKEITKKKEGEVTNIL